MALSHAILTFLSESPQSGYDLHKRFESSISFFWKASHQQIYRELANMERLGWVTPEAIPQKGKPDKKLYQITPDGQTELEVWFQSPCVPNPMREDILVKVLAGTYIEHSALFSQVNEQQLLHQAQLNQYLEQEAYFLSLPNPDKSQKLRYLTLRRGILYEMEWVKWCEEVLTVLQTMT